MSGDNGAAKRYRRTRKGLAAVIYHSQKYAGKKKVIKTVDYTREEFMRWLFVQENFESLYLSWVESDYQKALKPSADRILNNHSYTLSNLELMTWEQNESKARADMRSGDLICIMNPQKGVQQYTENDILVGTFISMNEANRSTGVMQSSISMCCHNKRNIAGGFKWKLI